MCLSFYLIVVLDWWVFVLCVWLRELGVLVVGEFSALWVGTDCDDLCGMLITLLLVDCNSFMIIFVIVFGYYM